jgi:hypothetical protein
MRFSTRAKYGSMSLARTPSIAASRHQRSRMRRGAPRHAAVDHGRAADRAALLVQHRRIAHRHRRAAVAVELADRRRRVGGEVAGGPVAALLDHHVEAALGQLGGERRAARARADDHHVGVEHQLAVDRVAGGDAGRDALLADRGAGQGHHHTTSRARGALIGGRSGSGSIRLRSGRAMSAP